MGQYKDFLDIEISDRIAELGKSVHPFMVEAEYKGKWSKKIHRMKKQSKAIAYKDSLFACDHVITTPDEIPMVFEENGKKYSDQFEKSYEGFAVITRDGRILKCKVRSRDQRSDSAVLAYPRFMPGEKSPYRLNHLDELGDSDKLMTGDFIFSLLTPGMIKSIYGEGKVTSTSLPKSKLADVDENAFFTHNIQSIYGDSSSPVFAIDDGPKLIGLVSGFMGYNFDNIGYVMPYASKINNFRRQA